MEIFWDKEKRAIAIKCETDQEFVTMMKLLEEKTETKFSIQQKDE